MKILIRYSVIQLFCYSAACILIAGCTGRIKNDYSRITTPTGTWQLVWHDEFDYTGLPDSTKWSYDTEGNAWGWGNNEAQWYTKADNSNAWVDAGILTRYCP